MSHAQQIYAVFTEDRTVAMKLFYVMVKLAYRRKFEMNGFGKRLKELRVAAGLSQEKLANQLQVTVKSIQRYESGYRPDTYVLVQLATYFNVSADYLLG